MVRRLIPYLLALVLGVGAAALVACGDAGTRNGIPGADADRINSDFEDVQQAVDGSRCTDLNGQLGQLERRIDRLSAEDVDNELVDRLRQASQNLRGRAKDECNAANAETTETAPETQTESQPTVTTVAPPPETQPKTTAPEPETTPPPQTSTTPEPAIPPDSDGDTVPEGGGVQPEVVP